MIDIGIKAPYFNLCDIENRSRSLREFLGQKVVLIFFVEEFTFDSTKELCLFRDNIMQLINLDAQVVGIEKKSPAKNKLLSEKQRLHFPILSDAQGKVSKAYGIDKRTIIILDENGVILYTWIAKELTDEPDFEEIKRHLKPFPLHVQAQMVVPTMITISRQLGSGGDEIAQHVSQMLGWSYVDKALVVDIGRSLGYHEEDIVDFCEDNYRVQSFVDKLLLRRKPTNLAFNTQDNQQIEKTLNEEQCLNTIQTVINNLAARGKVVIVGRGGQAILKNKVGVLHVRVIAPQTTRIHRIMQKQGLSEDEALKQINDNDKAAFEYIERFYSIDWSDPTNYDIVLNTAKIDVSTAALMIASIASQENIQ